MRQTFKYCTHLLVKRCVHKVGPVILRVKGHRGDRHNHDGHAEGNRSEEHDDVVRSILEVQLLLDYQLLFVLRQVARNSRSSLTSSFALTLLR